MGLPSAQLGSLPSMNVPSSVPVVGVQKSPKIWQQALLNILTQTAGAAATQGIGNVMSQDYADDPATGWEKLTKGPRMDKSQKMQKTSLDAASGEAAKGREFTAGENRTNRDLTVSEANLTRKQQADLAKSAEQLQRDLDFNREQAAMIRLLTGGKMDMDKIFASGQITRDNMGAASTLDQNTPLTKAKVELTNAEVEKAKAAIAQQKAMQALLSGTGQKPGPGDQAGAQRPPVQRAVGDGTGPFPQASDALASLYMALTAENASGGTAPVPPVDAGVPSPYVAMRLGIQPQRENNMRAPAPELSTGPLQGPNMPEPAELQVLQGAPYSLRAQEIRRKYGLPQ